MRILRLLIVVCLCFVAPLLAQLPAGQQPQQVQARWDKIFSEGASKLRREPSRLLVEVTRDSTPGTALDLGTGEGRNALFLAENGWTVTGLDISPVAIQQARKNATDRKLNIEAIVADLDAFDFGQQRWNLITSFFMHAWHGRSKTDVPVRIYDALKPGGVVVIEAFANPPSPI